jgi:hypothetical protein
VLPDGSIEPHKPDLIRLRDGPPIRPVCPFIEIWARLGEPGSDPSIWRDAPLTPTLLAARSSVAENNATQRVRGVSRISVLLRACCVE